MYVKDRLRRSMMFVPGNNPGMIRDAHIYGADSIMFDLEDSVAYTEKDTARFLVYNALKTLHFGSKETVVRINDLSSGLGIKDLEAVVRAGASCSRAAIICWPWPDMRSGCWICCTWRKVTAITHSSI